jgi:hypothetical protein
MLFTEGVRKTKKPKFDKIDLRPNRQILVGVPKIDWDAFFNRQPEKDAGADISTIIRLYEEGLL